MLKKVTLETWPAQISDEAPSTPTLILERDGQLFPFEIKLTATPTRRDASGLLAFRKAHESQHVAKGAILCATDRPFWIAPETAALPWNLLS